MHTSPDSANVKGDYLTRLDMIWYRLDTDMAYSTRF